ncbi:alpha/beta hydrolase [Actinoplanes sp. KI2]|uniref:alpha/beta hydrolase n=1 Tax=Actinoplanes sp. KI2 TaxID=2983315 RepID=UPI0021D57279|nr:alpha/beta hydrolase [Actinoplanes sp. KI2]MCU7731177.1 alpha/beta hydrolase [Actinoplanes sp. KI2]
MNSLLTVLLVAAMPVPAAPPGDTLDWHDCGKALDAQCATLTVPADWSHPGAGTIGLPVARRAATDQAHKVGTLVFGPGGPWDSGVDRVANGYRRFGDDVLSRFDIVSFDPRGSSNGRPLPCDTTGLPAAPAPVLTSQADFDAAIAYNRKLWERCSTSYGEVWNHADMISNARDVDALRTALGVRQISFHGSSYGTLLGETYAERYPGRVRAMVLESVDDHSARTTAAFLTAQATAFEDAFDDFARWCDSTASCALNPLGGARTVWHRLIGTHNQFDLAAVALKRLKDAEYAVLAGYLATVDGGGPALHVTDMGVVIPAFCADWSLPVRDYASYAALLRKTSAVAPDTGYPAQVFALTMCLGWPRVADPQHALTVRTAAPLLLLNSRHDPATGLSWAQSVERQLGRHGVLVTYEGAGHGSYSISDCMKRVADDYLVSLAVPPRGTTCPAVG